MMLLHPPLPPHSSCLFHCSCMLDDTVFYGYEPAGGARRTDGTSNIQSNSTNHIRRSGRRPRYGWCCHQLQGGRGRGRLGARRSKGQQSSGVPKSYSSLGQIKAGEQARCHLAGEIPAPCERYNSIQLVCASILLPKRWRLIEHDEMREFVRYSRYFTANSV